MANYSNPFVIGKYVSKELFCDREEETRLLRHHVINGRNVTIMSERRMGKTGLIEHTFANALGRNDYYTFLIDIYTAKNLRDMVKMLANEVYNIFVRKQSLLEKLTQFVQSLRTTVTYNSITGEPEVSIGLGEINTPEVTLDEILTCLEHADRPCIIAIDEFQKIAQFVDSAGSPTNYYMEELLRTKIQHLKNTQFIFAGSERHLLEGIFNDPERPFYNSVVFMQLLPIEEMEYIKFCKRLFAKYDKSVEEDLARKLYEYFHGVTWYLQLSMNEAFSLIERNDTIGMESFYTILHNMVDTKRFTFEDRFALLTEKQKAVIEAMAMEFPNNIAPTSKEFITKYNLKTSSSVQTAIKGLTEKGFVIEIEGTKQISDLLFMLWLKKF